MFDEARLDSIFAEVELEAGLPPAIVAARNPLAVVAPVFTVRKVKPPRWTAEEEQFLQDSPGVLTLEEIAARLGRSVNAVKIRQVRRLFPAASKRPGWLTGRQVADILGVDIHNIMILHERGLIPLQRLPGERGILTMRQVTLYRWAVNPEHWPYFIRSVRNTARITDPHLRRLIERQKVRWGDEWWSIGEVARYHRAEERTLNAYIHRGKIRVGVQWGNWWFRRSEVTRPDFVLYTGKGGARAAAAAAGWSPAADAYIVRAKAEGLTWAGIAARMKRDERSVQHRGRKLLKQAMELVA